MGKLSDILASGGFGGDDFNDRWGSTSAADDYGPLPPGEYVAVIDRGELTTVGAKATASYKLTFAVIEGPGKSADYVGRLFWHDLWLTPTALPMTKRDLLKLGVTDPSQLERTVPPGIVCRVRLALRRDDDGVERNRVARFDVDRIEPPESDPYAPPADAPESEGEADAA